MTAENWKRSLAAVLASEGGNDDDPEDHGGRTSRGITQREYDSWRRENHMPMLDVWQAPQSDVETIYHDEYWEPWGDLLPAGTDYMFFDASVLEGPHAATVNLQRALGVAADGRVGPVTRQAIGKANPVTLVESYTNVKNAYYRSLHQPKFLRGWLNRNAQVRATALAMLEKAPGEV